MPDSPDPQLRLLDTNIVLRLVIQDVPAQTQQAVRLFDTAGEHSLVLTDIVILEAVYVMEKLYRYERTTIASSLQYIINHPGVQTQELIWNAALGLYQEAAISIADAYLCTLANFDRQTLVSLDQRLQRYAKVDDLNNPNEL